MTAIPIYTMGAMLRSSAAAEGTGKPALVLADERLSYAELDASARAWAKAFVAMGAMPGDKIGLLLGTRADFVSVYFGIQMVGAVAVPINARYRSAELGFLIGNADLTLLVTTARVVERVDFVERLGAALPTLADQRDPAALMLADAPLLRSIICLDPPCAPAMLPAATALSLGDGISDAAIDARIDAVAPADIAMILYTSGTTAHPKGALISNRAMVGNARNVGRRYAVTADDCLWSPLPIFHIGGILPLTMMLAAGGTYVTVAHFEAGLALGMLERERATIAYPTFVTIMQDLITHPDFATTDLSRLRMMNSNFAVQPRWIMEAVTGAMPHTIQIGTYGLTESVGPASTSRLTDSFEKRVGRCGYPVDEWEFRIVDPDTGAALAPGERGEIVLRGPNMLSGYYKAPEQTAAAIRDGWFHTGDIGSIDDEGFVMFHGRSKDMFKVGGENVAAAEVEAVLQTHPSVKLAQVVAIPDDRYVEVPAAFVEVQDGAAFDAGALSAHCRDRLASFKVPRHVRQVAEWPMSTSKIQKFRLREALIAELAGDGDIA